MDRAIDPGAAKVSVAVLLSAGLDSAVLAADQARIATVHPIYVAAGLSWESEERLALDRLLQAECYRALAPLASLTFPVADLYPESHWALRGRPPAFDTPDEDVYLLGRNVILLSKAAIHCARHGIDRIVLGPLADNPFPDATPEFFAAMGKALGLGLAQEMAITAPYAGYRKSDVIRLGMDIGVPLELTMSCMNPQAGRHCGQCSKCRERRDAFREAAVHDATAYAMTPRR